MPDLLRTIRRYEAEKLGFEQRPRRRRNSPALQAPSISGHRPACRAGSCCWS